MAVRSEVQHVLGDERAAARPSAAGRVAAVVWIAALAALLALNAAKGWNTLIQVWGWPYWLISYDNGYVRRGLAGEIFHLLLGKGTLQTYAGPVLAQHIFWVICLAGAAAYAAGGVLSRLKGPQALGFLGVASWILVSQFWPTQLDLTGYLDPVVIALATLAAFLWRAKRVLATAAVMLVGPFVHEYFVFLVPFILTAAMPAPSTTSNAFVPLDHKPSGDSGVRAYIILGAVAVLAAGAATLLSSASATATQISHMALDEDTRHTLQSITFTQGIGGALALMLSQWAERPIGSLYVIAVFMPPAIVSCLGILFWRARPSWANLIRVGAGLFPVASLLLAWDLSRLLVASSYTCGMLFFFAARERVGPQAMADGQAQRKPGLAGIVLSCASIAAAAAYGIQPFLYSYFPPAEIIAQYPAPLGQDGLTGSLRHSMLLRWSGIMLVDHPMDLTCLVTSSLPRNPGDVGCARVLREKEIIDTPVRFLHAGRYRFQFLLSPAKPCADASANLQISTPARSLPLSKTTVTLGADLVVRMDMRIGADAQDGVVMQATGLTGDACATLKQVSVSRLGQTS